MKPIQPDERYLLALLKSILHEELPPEKPENCSFEQVFVLAKRHSVANMAYYAIQKLKQKPDAALLCEWKEVYEKALVKDVIQQNELALIEQALEQQRIAFVPLKGVAMKKLYPRCDMRMMSDIDVLVAPEDTHRVQAVLLSLGYEADRFGVGNHDVYFKRPVMNVEVHHALFDRMREQFVTYFADFFDRAQTVEGKQYQRRFSEEDFFLFLFCHLVKHYRDGGTGIRSVMDLWVYLQAKGDVLNWTVVSAELDKLGLNTFLSHMMRLSKIWFGGEETSTLYEEMGAYVLANGTYGTMQNKQLNAVAQYGGNANSAKWKHLFRLFFPKLTNMQMWFPTLERYPVLLPFYYVFRGLRIVFCRREKFVKISQTITADKGSLYEVRQLHEKTGLKGSQ